jgi:hypothetical protein
MKNAFVHKALGIFLIFIFTAINSFGENARYVQVSENGSLEFIESIQDTCPYEIDFAGEICCDTSGCAPQFDPGIIYETSPPTGGTGNFVYMWLISELQFRPDGSSFWTTPDAIRNPDGSLYGGRDYAPGPLDVPTRFRRCVSTEECRDANYPFVMETDIIEIYVEDCNCEPDSGGEIGVDQTSCLPFYDPSELISIQPAIPADSGDLIIYEWYGSFLNIPFNSANWFRIRGANLETYDPPSTDRDVYYIRRAYNPFCRDSSLFSNIVKILIGGDFVVQEDVKNNLCNGANEGSIQLNISGNGPFQVDWQDGAIGAIRNNLSAGTYFYTITDDIGCSKSNSLEITEPSELSLLGQADSLLCNGDADASINITASGGTPGYLYNWDIPSTVEDPSGLTAGTYCINCRRSIRINCRHLLRDGYGCKRLYFR